MKKIISITIMCIIVFMYGHHSESFADSYALEEISYADEKGWKQSLAGCFSQPCIFQPGIQNLFVGTFYGEVSTIIKSHSYFGRTGEKTFDIEHASISSFRSKREEKREIYHYYFTPNDTVVLTFVSGFKKCTKNDYVYLKMLELKNNSLKYQIILPACAKQ